jgi:KDO2-lipid IV(A) lauroyltransferase
VAFFGVPAMTYSAMTTLGILGKAVAVPYFPRRLENGSYVISILPAMEGFPSDDADRDAAAYYRMIEDRIRQYPEQYYWIHKKFKKRPAPLPDVYANLETLR